MNTQQINVLIDKLLVLLHYEPPIRLIMPRQELADAIEGLCKVQEEIFLEENEEFLE